MRFKVGFEGWVVTSEGAPPSREELDGHLDLVMDQLKILGFRDATIEAAPDEGHVEITVILDSEDWDEAQSVGSSGIRTAIHAAGGATPHWSIDWCKVTIERSLTPA